jgi:mannobiose 2-epimerase
LPNWGSVREPAPDKEYGGLLGRLNRKGEPVGSGDKSVVLISRALWSFSEAYRRYPDPAYQKVAAECLKFLREKMWDKERGGYYFMVTRKGDPVDDTKQLNPMSYVMEGLAEYALAFHDNQAVREALDLFQVIDQHAHDNQYGGYRIAFTKDWQWIKDYKDGPNGAGSFGRKSYDWHLGLVEALAISTMSPGIPVFWHVLRNCWTSLLTRSSMPTWATAATTSTTIGALPTAMAIQSNASMGSTSKPVG